MKTGWVPGLAVALVFAGLAAGFRADGGWRKVRGDKTGGNVGERKAPDYRLQPFPKEGEFPAGQIARAAIVDWNNDGIPDLLVSDNSGTVRLALNKGTAQAPRWRFEPAGLTIPWGFVRSPGVRALTKMDGRSVFLSGKTLYGFLGSPHTPRLTELGLTTARASPSFPPALVTVTSNRSPVRLLGARLPAFRLEPGRRPWIF